MREIKFIVWDSITKELHSWDRIKGIPIIKFELDHYYLMQYTGLKDDNGKEIYEGYIIELYEDNDKYGWGPVSFKNGCFYLNDMMFPDIVDEELKVKIIGNIYETPELC